MEGIKKALIPQLGRKHFFRGTTHIRPQYDRSLCRDNGRLAAEDWSDSRAN